jgi:antitoxin MazE
MLLSIIEIGNSKGIRLPKAVIEKYHLTSALELVMEDDRIVLIPKRTPRQGWAAAAKRMREAGEDQLLIPDFFEDENLDEHEPISKGNSKA